MSLQPGLGVRKYHLLSPSVTPGNHAQYATAQGAKKDCVTQSKILSVSSIRHSTRKSRHFVPVTLFGPTFLFHRAAVEGYVQVPEGYPQLPVIAVCDPKRCTPLPNETQPALLSSPSGLQGSPSADLVPTRPNSSACDQLSTPTSSRIFFTAR